MAIFDALFEFLDDGQLIGNATTDYNAGTAVEVDWVAADLEMGAGTPIWWNVRVGTTAYAGGTSVDFKLFADDTSEGHDSDSDIVLATGARPVAELSANAWVCRVPLPVNVDDGRYLQVGATFVGNVTAGTVDSWLDHGPQSSFDTQVSASNI